MTPTNIFKAAHKLAKAAMLLGDYDYRACFSSALKEVYASEEKNYKVASEATIKTKRYGKQAVSVYTEIKNGKLGKQTFTFKGMEFELEKRPMKEFDSRFVGRFWVDKVTVINVEVLESSAALALREASIIEPIRKDNFGTVNWWAAGMIGE